MTAKQSASTVMLPWGRSSLASAVGRQRFSGNRGAIVAESPARTIKVTTRISVMTAMCAVCAPTLPIRLRADPGTGPAAP